MKTQNSANNVERKLGGRIDFPDKEMSCVLGQK